MIMLSPKQIVKLYKEVKMRNHDYSLKGHDKWLEQYEKENRNKKEEP